MKALQILKHPQHTKVILSSEPPWKHLFKKTGPNEVTFAIHHQDLISNLIAVSASPGVEF